MPEDGGVAVLCALLAFAIAAVLGRHAARRWLDVGAGLVALASGLVAAALAWLAVGVVGGWSQPVLDGFLISGGASLTPEFLALWLGLSLFTSASIAELVRAGAEAVPAGQWHAALALGMTRGRAIAGVIFPQALRLAIPPLASQYMNLIKNSSLAVVIGYPDLVSIGNTSINQNGQALEVIVIIMAVYLSLNLVVAVIMGAVNRARHARAALAPRARDGHRPVRSPRGAPASPRRRGRASSPAPARARSRSRSPACSPGPAGMSSTGACCAPSPRPTTPRARRRSTVRAGASSPRSGA